MPLLSVEGFVRIEMTPVALGLGSNKQFSGLRPEEILGGAIFELSKTLHSIEISSLYRTKAMYVVDQEDFYNMALVGLLDDGISARDLLEKIHKIEAMFGRDREKEIRFGSRTLDIDIECFGRKNILEPDLQIPHPRLTERAFVLIPLLEVLDGLENRKAAAGKDSACATTRSLKAHVLETPAGIIPAQETATQNNSARIAAHSSAAPISQAARPVSQDASPSATEAPIISSNAAARCADTVSGEIFCLCRDEISAALFSLGEKDGGVEKIIRAQDFLPFIHSRLQDGTRSK